MDLGSPDRASGADLVARCLGTSSNDVPVGCLGMD